ncbi:hypothetical protein BCR32DRAFT_330521 [Anaeromyces robustus]|uniref:Uncharacterized protein n=1 Tax=Anaeromyces robustus TaxID=1754192 RepID=A0A1Y1VUQ6_9FUNG|nr:hypothetical protein BCR32DRAFT_330521 [Anaeromyces robustus]|eukprot:ORX64746.1 hypothetical protein BCR32DRAFT_330521 [Anaeromyces robustus]
MKNEDMIKQLKELGLNKLKEKYTLLERPINETYKNLNINGLKFDLNHYEIVGVGNLSIMGCNSPFFQMFTFVVTFYYKDIPMFSSDFILKGNKHDVINEIYSLVTNKEDKLYKQYLEILKENMASCKLADNPVKPSWCDEWRPTFVNKSGTDADDEAIIKLFEKNMDTLIELEQKSDYIEDINKRVAKYDITKEYVDKLVDNGGVSTDMFKAVIGVESTKKFYHTFVFGNECFKPSY